MEIRELNYKERQILYKEHLSQDFHADEVKANELIEKLVAKGQYITCGFFENGEQRGYAYLAKTQDGKEILLDYLVVFEEFRSMGYGSVFLKLIRDYFDKDYEFLLAEVENPAYSQSDKDKTIRERRINFYKKNQFHITDIKSIICSDHYNIICLPFIEKPSNQKAFTSLNKIYDAIFDSDFLEKYTLVER